MDQLFSILLLLNLSGSFSKYVYIKNDKHRDEALNYCQQIYTDLAPVSNERDMVNLRELSGNNNDKIWIGLQRSSSNQNKWFWSGGGEVSRTFWDNNEPGNNNDHIYGFIKDNKWHDGKEDENHHVFCYNAIVVKEEKTWEEALEYCREHHDDLASVASQTEMLLIQTELNNHSPTEHIWIGLRFFSGDWLWVDGQEMDYEAWGQGEKPSCPEPKMKCGALQVTGGTNGVWVAHDCEERLNFTCY